MLNHYDSFFAGIFVTIIFMMISIAYYEGVLETTSFCWDCDSFADYGERIDKTWTGMLLVIPFIILIKYVQHRWDKK